MKNLQPEAQRSMRRLFQNMVGIFRSAGWIVENSDAYGPPTLQDQIERERLDAVPEGEWHIYRLDPEPGKLHCAVGLCHHVPQDGVCKCQVTSQP